jgi:hypothetical protein
MSAIIRTKGKIATEYNTEREIEKLDVAAVAYDIDSKKAKQWKYGSIVVSLR